MTVGRLVRGFASILGAKVGSVVAGVLITPFLVRALGSSLYGDYAFLLSVLGVTMIVVNAGVFDGIRKYIAEDRNRPHWTERVLGFYLAIAAVTALIVALGFVMGALSGWPERFLGQRYGVYFGLLGGVIIVKQAFLVGRGGLMGLGREHYSEPVVLVERVVFGLVGVSLAYSGFGVAGVLVGQIAGGLVAALIMFVLLARTLDVRAVVSPPEDEFPRRELLSFNGLSILLVLLTASLYHVDILLLKPLSGSASTGYYRAALVVAEYLWFIPNALQILLVQSSSELWSRDEEDRITAVVARITRYNVLVTLLLVIGLGVLAEEFVSFYFGPEYHRAVLPLRLLLPGALGFAVARPIFATGQGKGALRVLILATGGAATLNAVLNVLLIPRFGTTGAAVATSIGYGSMLLLHVRAAREIGFDPLAKLPLTRIAICGLVTLPVIMVVSGWTESAVLSLTVVPIVGLLVYGGMTVLTGAMSWEEASMLYEKMAASARGRARRDGRET